MTDETDETEDPTEAEEAALADFDIGFQARLENKPVEPDATPAWKKGWADADRSFR